MADSLSMLTVVSATNRLPAWQISPKRSVYTITGGDTANIDFNIQNNELVWFVDAAAAAGGVGNQARPFQAITAAASADSAGDTIFVEHNVSSYACGITLETNEKLIGEGSGSTLATLSGVTPAIGSAFPILTNTSVQWPTLSTAANCITLSSGNTLRGLNLSSAGGTTLTGINFGSLTIADMSVANSAGTAVNLNNGNPTASFTSISASNGANGIVLNNTTGSFTVTGDGGGTKNGSGGTIQNTTGDGITLNTATNVSLTQLNVTDTANQADGIAGDDHAIDITSVTNFTFEDAIIDGFGDNDSHHNNQHNVRILNLFGTSSFDNVTFNDMNEHGIEYINNLADNGSQDVLTVSNSTFNGHNSRPNSDTKHGIQAKPGDTANMGLVVNNTTFNIDGDGFLGIDFESSGTSTSSLTISNSIFNALSAFGSGSIETENLNNSISTIMITGNRVNDSGFNPLNILNRDNATTAITIQNNDLDGRGNNNGFGIRLRQDENGTLTAFIDDNDIEDISSHHIRLEGDDTTNGTGIMNATVTNNTSVDIPTTDFNNGLDAFVFGNNTMCLDIRSNNFQQNDGGFPGFTGDIVFNRNASATMNIEQTSAANISALNNGDSVLVLGPAPNFSAADCPLP